MRFVSPICRTRAVATFCVVALLLPAGRLAAREEPADLRNRAFALAYNLDHDEATKLLEGAVAERPDDPAGYRSLAALVWLRILFLRGAVTVDDYMGGISGPKVKVDKPPGDLAERFQEYSQKAIELAERLIEKQPRDADAHYELGASLGLAASYVASIEGEPLRALRDARRAYKAHERVLELDPGRTDANLIIGIYRYVVSILPAPLRMMAYLVGFDGGKEEALKMIEDAAAHPSEAQPEARFALVLFYNREKRYSAAQRVIDDLKRQYPRNRIIWLESASTHLRAERPAAAERMLQEGFAMLERDTRPRMFGEEAYWRYKRGEIRVALKRPADAVPDLEAAIAGESQLWIKGRAHLELGKVADLAGERARAKAEYERAEAICDDARDRRCRQLAEQLMERGYKGE